MGKNRNRIANRAAMANGVSAATAVQQVQTDHLASAVSWACKAEFGPSLSWLTCGFYLTEYVKGALVKEKARASGGGNLSATRSGAKKIAEGRILEATGSTSLPDVDELIRVYNAYALLSGHVEEPSTTTCDAPWSGFRALGALVYRKDAESEGWTFAEAVDVPTARKVYTDWLTVRPRITVKALEGSVRQLLGLAPKVKPEKTASKEATPAQDSGEKQATAIVPGTTVAPNATVNPPTPSEGAVGDNPAAASVAAQEAQPNPTETDAPNPNYVPGAVVSTTETSAPEPPATTPVGTATGEDFDDTEDVEEDAPDSKDTKSDLPKPRERKADVNAIAFDGKPENVAAQFLEVLLSYDEPKDGDKVMTTLGHLLAHESMENSSLLSSLLEAYCEVSQDKETLEGIAEMAATKAASLTATATAAA